MIVVMGLDMPLRINKRVSLTWRHSGQIMGFGLIGEAAIGCRF
jgi:hypothetical protein